MENHITSHNMNDGDSSESIVTNKENQGDFSEIIGRDSTRKDTTAEPKGDTIVVAGLTSKLTDNDILNYFDQFGKMLEVTMPYDTIKKQRKGFFIIRYDSGEVVDNLLKMTNPKINETKIVLSRVLPTGDNIVMRSSQVVRGRGSTGNYGIHNLQRNDVAFANSPGPRTYQSPRRFPVAIMRSSRPRWQRYQPY